MFITSGISIVLSCLISIYCLFSSFPTNLTLSTHQFPIHHLPFIVAIEQDNSSKNLFKESDEAEKNQQDGQKKKQKKQWTFPESSELPQDQVKPGYMSEMKSRLEQSSSAVKGTSENATMLRVYLNQDGS